MRHRRLNRFYAYQGNIPSFSKATLAAKRSAKRASKILGAVTLAAAIMIQMACAPNINILKGAVGAFAPLVQYLISQGKITPGKAAAYTKDANDLIDGFGVLQTDWAAAKTKADKAVAVGRFANTTAIIAGNGDFGKIPQLAAAMIILNTTLAVVEAFYGGAPPSDSPRAKAGPPPSTPKNEGELNDYVKTQKKALERMLQPR